jgi:hypothetical protein
MVMAMRSPMGGPGDGWCGENRKPDRTQQKYRPSFSSKCHLVSPLIIKAMHPAPTESELDAGSKRRQIMAKK